MILSDNKESILKLLKWNNLLYFHTHNFYCEMAQEWKVKNKAFCTHCDEEGGKRKCWTTGGNHK